MSPLERFIRGVVGDLRYERRYPATVVAAHGDETVDLAPDDTAIAGRGLQKVPVLTGVAGATSLPEPGTRCLLGFDEGDPRKPRVVAWAYVQGSATVLLDGGAAAVARNGDLVDVLLSASSPISGLLQGTVTTPGSPPVVTPVPPGTHFSGVAVVTVKPIGRVLGGARRIKA